MMKPKKFLDMLIAAATVLLAPGCGCPEDGEVCGTCKVEMGEWEESTVTSSSTGDTYTYLHHPSRKEGAPVMVLLPGLLFDARMFVNMDELADEFELYALHYPEVTEEFTGSQLDLARIVDDFVEALDLNRFVLLGNSLGGFVAMQYFRVDEQDRVQALVLVSTQVFDPNKKERKKRLRTASLLKKRSDRFLLCLIKKMVQRTKSKKEAPDAQHDVFNIFRVKDVAFYRHAIDIMDVYDGNSGAEEIDVPVLVLHGSEDELAGVENTEHTMKLIPQAELVIIEGAGHEGPFSRGGDFAEAVLGWWDGGKQVDEGSTE